MLSCAFNYTIITDTSSSLALDQGSSQTYKFTTAFIFFSIEEFYAVFKTLSVNGPHLNVWGFDISSA